MAGMGNVRVAEETARAAAEGSSRATNHNATQNRGVAAPRLGRAFTVEEQRLLEQLEKDYWKPTDHLSNAEFVKRHAISRPDAEHLLKEFWAVRNEEARLSAALIKESEAKHGTIGVDRQRQREDALADYNRGVAAVRSSVLATPFMLYAQARGGSLKQQADAAELGQALGALGGGAIATGAAVRNRRALREYKTSGRLLEDPRPKQGERRQTDPEPSSIPKTVSPGAISTPQATEQRGQAPAVTNVDRSATDENRGLISDHNLNLQPPHRVGRRSARKVAQEGAEQGLIDPAVGRLGFQSHSTARSVAAALQVSEVESAHVVPQTIGRHIPGYSAGRALTTLLPKAAHVAFDQAWVHRWKRAVKSGQRVTAGDVYGWLHSAIETVPADLLSQHSKGTLQWRLHQEMYRDLGLTPATVLVPGQ